MKPKKQGYNLKPNKLIVIATIFVAGFLSYPLFVENSPILPTTKAPIATSPQSMDVCFTPGRSCLPKIIKHIDGAKTSILLLGYSFTSKPITQALIRAKKRGVSVRIVLDHSQKSQKYSKEIVQTLLNNHLDVKFDHSVKIAHNKVIIIDNLYTVTGSYNWTHSAEFKNAENLVFISSQEIAKKCGGYFKGRWTVSKNLKG
jgi:phosphatidylserine/phosphatidylglycerophosphate/cardiolipin synthase-like enzyme